MTEIEKLVEWLAETAFNAGYADCASTYDIPRRLTVIEADAANDAAKAALLAALKGAEGERDRALAVIGKAIINLPPEYRTHDLGLLREFVFHSKLAEARAEKAEAERDAAVAALEELLLTDGSPSNVDSAEILAQRVRARARAALASNSGGG